MIELISLAVKHSKAFWLDYWERHHPGEPLCHKTRKEPPYGKAPHAIFLMHNLSPCERLLYLYLNARCYQNTYCFPSLKTIARDMGSQPSRIHATMGGLIKAGLVRAEKVSKKGRPYKVNRYHMVDLELAIGEAATLDFGMVDFAMRQELRDEEEAEAEGLEEDEETKDEGGGCLHTSRQEKYELLATRSMYFSPREQKKIKGEVEKPGKEKLSGAVAEAPAKRELKPGGELRPPAVTTVRVETTQTQVGGELESNGLPPTSVRPTGPVGDSATQLRAPQAHREPPPPAPSLTPPAAPPAPTAAEIRKMVSDVTAGKARSAFPDPEDFEGIAVLRARAKVQAKEDKAAYKREQADLKARERANKAAPEGSPGRQLWNTYAKACEETNRYCDSRPLPKDVHMLNTMADTMGSVDKACDLIRFVMSNWDLVREKFPGLTGEPGINLFLSNWRTSLAQFAAEHKGSAASTGPSNEEEIAKLKVAKKRGEPIDEQHLTNLMGTWPDGIALERHLKRLGYYG